MKHSTFFSIFATTALLFCGCVGYQRGSAVPAELRTIHVPAFENQTEYPMVGAIIAQQFLDCLIEDGSFTPNTYEDARLRMQAIVVNCGTESIRYDRNERILPSEYALTITVEMHIFDAQTGESYIRGKKISATESMLTRGQYQTGIQDALPRVARKLARSLVDELNTIEKSPVKMSPIEESIDDDTTTTETAVLLETEVPTEEPVADDEAMAEAPAIESELPAEAETPAEVPVVDEAELPAEAEAPAEVPVVDDEAMAEAPAEEAPTPTEAQE